MGTRSILLAVKEPQELVDITQALGAGWKVTSVASEADALAQLEKREADAILVDFNLVSPDASDLVNEAAEKHPEAIQFLLAYEADLALVAAKINGSPHLLPKPLEPDSLKNRIESEVAEPDHDQAESESASAAAKPATPTSIYAEVLKALEAPGVTCERIGDIVAGDAELTAELLKITQSSYLGLPRNIKSTVEAVEALGLLTVKAIVMALQFLAEHSRLNSGYLSLDQIWQHSIKTGQLARDLVLFETKDRALARQALMAGVLHDLGKVVLATNFDDLYGRVHSLARKQPVALWEVEKEMFGANHGEIGGCLLGMWQMPGPIVDAAALHHEPPLGENQDLTPLAAVHVANVLVHELSPGEDDMMVAPIINTTFLNEIGLLQRLPVWRASFANRTAANPEIEATPEDVSQADERALETWPEPEISNRLSEAVSAEQTPNSGRTRRAKPALPDRGTRSMNAWVLAFVAGIAVLLTVWFSIQRDLKEAELVYARTAAPWLPSTQASAAASQEVRPAAAVSQEPVANPESAPLPTASMSEQKPAASAPIQTVADSQPTPSLPVADAAPVATPKAVPAVAAQESHAARSASENVGSSAVSIPAQRAASVPAVPVASVQPVITIASAAPAPIATPKAAPVVTISQEPPALGSTSDNSSATAATPAPQKPVATPVATLASAQPPSPAPQQKTTPNFKVNGIIYSTIRPTAIVNGRMVDAGDRVDGATVIAIGRTNVTLEINGQRKTYVME